MQRTRSYILAVLALAALVTACSTNNTVPLSDHANPSRGTMQYCPTCTPSPLPSPTPKFGTPDYAPTPDTFQAPTQINWEASTVPCCAPPSYILQDAKVYIDYWGWQSDPDGVKNYLNQFVTGVGGSPWLQTAGNYNEVFYDQFHDEVNEHVRNPANILGGTWDDTASVPTSPTAAQIAAEAEKAYNHFGGGTDAIYFVATPTGHSESGFGNWCAYHSWVQDGSAQVTYAYLPYIPDEYPYNCDSSSYGTILDGVSHMAGHEIAEALTDPYLNFYTIINPNPPNINEMADLCAWTNLTNIQLSTGTFQVQPLYSIATSNAGTCALSSSALSGP